MKLINADLRQLRAFAAVADELNFVRASERLNVSQPALSHTIRNLELELGFGLFDRDTRHVRLTDKGRLLLVDVKTVLDEFETLSNKARALAKNFVGTLKVGYLIGAAVDLMPAILRSFGELYPDVNIVLKEFDFSMPDAGIRSGMDVSILRPPIVADGIELAKLVEEPCVACVSTSHRLAGNTSVSIFELLEESFVAAPGAGIWRDYWLANHYRQGTSPKIVYEAPTFESEFQAVASGKGISITPMAASRFYARPGLAFPVIRDMPPCEVSIALPNKASALAREFTQMAVALAQDRSNQLLIQQNKAAKGLPLIPQFESSEA